MALLAERICAIGGGNMPSWEAELHASDGAVDGSRVRRMPPDRRLNPGERTRLVLEILASYMRARRAVREAPIEPAIASLRQRVQVENSRKAPVEEAPSSLPQRSTSHADDEPDALTLTEAQRLGRAVQLTLTLLPGDKRCLARSLVLTQLLARREISSKLVIGARTAPHFLAHAWVEHAGHPVLPVGDGSFGRLVEL
jgi:hypothetical protein